MNAKNDLHCFVESSGLVFIHTADRDGSLQLYMAELILSLNTVLQMASLLGNVNFTGM